MKIVILLTVFLAAYARDCVKDSDCDSSSCCVANYRFRIMSKRILPLDNLDVGGSSCVRYISREASCRYPGFASCGCEPGTRCVDHSVRRSAISRPGDSVCE